MEVGDSYDYYDILNVSQDAKLETITQAYKTLSRVHHPDKCNGADATFVKLKKAFDVLSDDTLRQFYDKYGQEGIHVAQQTDRGDMELALPEDKLATLEKNVRKLVRRHEELKEMRTVHFQGDSAMGFNLSVPRWESDAMRTVRRAGLRLQYSQTSMGFGFNSRLGKFTLGTLSHVQNAGAGVVKYMMSWQHQWTSATSSKVSFSTMGQGFGDCDAIVSHRVSKNLSLAQKIVWTRLSLTSYFCSAVFDFGGGMTSQAAITLLPQGMHYQLNAAKSFGSNSSVKATLETSKDDISLTLRSQYSPSEQWSISVAPTFNSSRGSGVLLETDLHGIPDELTTLTWGLHLRVRTLTLITKISRGGLSFSLPLEVDSPTLLPHPECAALALFVFVTVPYVLSRLRPKKPRPKKNGQTEVAEATLPGLQKVAAKRRQEEEAARGLIILQAVYGDAESVEKWKEEWHARAAGTSVAAPLCDVTDALMHKVRDSTLMISTGGPKNSLVGFPVVETTDSQRLGIRYRFGTTEMTCTYDDYELVHLP
eukprot:GEMP01035297.1.p1 GENE.GEMP01035297.1~~GEMP01035297.1.p1  ORF type:complete len:537 (+),score=98.26 GEMP01035297.1:106-1716(+)